MSEIDRWLSEFARKIKVASLEKQVLTKTHKFKLDEPDKIPFDDGKLWSIIRNRSLSNRFEIYKDYINHVFCGDSNAVNDSDGYIRSKCDGYEILKTSTEAFLKIGALDIDSNIDLHNKCTNKAELKAHHENNKNTHDKRDDSIFDGEKKRLNVENDVTYNDINNANVTFPHHPKIEQNQVNEDKYDIEKYDERKIKHPLLLEFIWSYWNEESLLVQACNALCLRFQNRRSSALRDPLANLTIDPLKPLSNIIWGFIENEQHRLSLKRRAYEYENEYGLPLAGKALGRIVPIESRTAFLSAFHHLIHRCAVFYQESSDMTVKPDGFPIATALKEVQMILAEGAINQYGDLPFQSRVEMMMMQWLMSQKEVEDFLGARKSMPYPEKWMPTVDTVKRMQGWSTVSSMHFGDLAFCSEPVILSIRHDKWNELDDGRAKAWCHYWKQDIQKYIHAYRATTGVDLNTPESVKAKAPSFYFVQHEQELGRRQVALQGR